MIPPYNMHFQVMLRQLYRLYTLDNIEAYAYSPYFHHIFHLQNADLQKFKQYLFYIYIEKSHQEISILHLFMTKIFISHLIYLHRQIDLMHLMLQNTSVLSKRNLFNIDNKYKL